MIDEVTQLGMVDKIMSRIKDKCNICATNDYLTEDHVPPKCCSNRGNVKFYRLFDKNINPNKKAGQFQKGICFKTICKKCNNLLLGQELDPYLGEFQDKVIDGINKCSTLLDTIVIKTKVNKISRAVIGHMLAAFPFYNDNISGIENDLRKYFFDKTSSSINGQYLYMWINNEKRVAIARNIGILLDPIFNGAIISLLKFPGVAFMLCSKKIDDGLIDLFEYTSIDIETEKEIIINLKSIYTKNGEERTTEWPLIVNDNIIFVPSPEIMTKSIFSTLLDL